VKRTSKRALEENLTTLRPERQKPFGACWISNLSVTFYLFVLDNSLTLIAQAGLKLTILLSQPP
jgi:hypothetical protein